MAACASCGVENRDEARFCDACGAALAAEPAREARKTVTVLFCDVTGSTQLGEQLDPESLRRVMARYFEVAKAVIERHGGAVEKFIGDAVMAVFGVPAVHEDDALRAVRAAAELRDALGDLNTELAESYGTRLELRTGVNTGEVVTGTEERLATGDAVNVAARLVKHAVEVEPIPPLALKGKAEPVPAFRLLGVIAGVPEAVRQTVPMVGRERQQNLLDDAFANVVGERSCHLFTILGTAGVGKSRLVSEFLAGLDGATVIGGRCLSYGEGISYWPVTSAVKELLGPAPDEVLVELGFETATARALGRRMDGVGWAGVPGRGVSAEPDGRLPLGTRPTHRRRRAPAAGARDLCGGAGAGAPLHSRQPEQPGGSVPRAVAANGGGTALPAGARDSTKPAAGEFPHGRSVLLPEKLSGGSECLPRSAANRSRTLGKVVGSLESHLPRKDF